MLTASGLQGREHRFIPPSTAASAAASVLASLSTSELASRGRPHNLLPTSIHPETTMYRSDRTNNDRYLKLYLSAASGAFYEPIKSLLLTATFFFQHV